MTQAGLADVIGEKQRVDEDLREREARFRALAATSREASISTDSAGRITYLNPAAEDVFGCSSASAARRCASALLSGRLGASCSAAFERFRLGASGLGVRTLELSATARGEGEPPIEMSLGAFDHGGIKVFTIVVHDVARRTRAERELAHRDAQLGEAQELARLGTFESDVSADVISPSLELYRIYGLHPEEVKPTWETFLDRVHPEDVARVRADVNRALRSRRPVSTLHCIVRGDGEVRELHTRMKVVDNDGTAAGARVIGMCQDVTEQRREAEERRESRERFRLAFENAPIGMALTALDGRWLQVNRALCEITGYPEEALLAGASQDITHPDDIPHAIQCAKRLLGGETRSCQLEMRYVHAEGHPVEVKLSMSLVRDVERQPRYFIAQIEDITERVRVEEENRRLEAALHQTQRLEMVGRLAGGIAHDFNNLMAVILNYAALLEQDLAGASDLVGEAAEIRKAAEQAAALTQRLAAFSSGEVVEPQVLHLNAIVDEADKLLRMTLGEGLELITDLSPEPWPVEADVDQLQRVLLNLAVNARDATPAGGSFLIRTDNVRVDSERAGRFPEAIAPGRYVRLSVRDTGCGMTEEVAARAFEPFYTTKGPKEGRGLGLATVYGVVRQAGGRVELDSEPGVGTTVRIYLPASEREPGRLREQLASKPGPGHGETILVVEDDDSVRALVSRILTRNRYRVLDAPGPEEAIRELDWRADQVALLLCDVVMPKMSGPELAKRLSAVQPGLRIVFMSGYTDEVVVGLGDAGPALLKKPFTVPGLLSSVEHALHGAQHRARS